MEPWIETQQKIERIGFVAFIAFVVALAHITSCSMLVEEPNDPNDSGTDISSDSNSNSSDGGFSTAIQGTSEDSGTGNSDVSTSVGTSSDTEVPTEDTGTEEGNGTSDTQIDTGSESGTESEVDTDSDTHTRDTWPTTEELQESCTTDEWMCVSNLNMFVCDPDWLIWDDFGRECKYGCNDGACHVCVLGEKQCYSYGFVDGYQECGEDGTWLETKPCHPSEIGWTCDEKPNGEVYCEPPT